MRRESPLTCYAFVFFTTASLSAISPVQPHRGGDWWCCSEARAVKRLGPGAFTSSHPRRNR